MIHITDGQTDVILADIPEEFFWDDIHKKSLKDTLETFDFTTFADQSFSEHLAKRNRIVIPDEDGQYIEFVIENTRKYRNSEGALFVEVYTSATYIDLAKAKVIAPQTTQAWSAQQHAEWALAGTEWEVGTIDFAGVRTLTIERHTNPYSYLKCLATEFDLELHFRVETDGNKVIRRYVDLVERVGMWRGREVEFGKDLLGIERKEDMDNIVTALVGIGPEREDGTRLQVFVEDKDALARWGRNGQHLVEVYEPDSTDSTMTIERLTTLTENELKKRVNSVVSYRGDIADLEKVPGLENEKIRFGDTIKIKDIQFSPPLYLEARVHTQERSIKRNGRKTVELGDYIEYTEEEVFAIWKSLQAEIAKKVSMTEVMEVAELKVHRDSTVPEDTAKLWMDTSVTPNVIKRFDGTNWVKATPTQAGEVGAYTKSEVDQQFTPIQIELNDHETRLGSAETRITNAENAISQAEQDLAQAEQNIADARADLDLITTTDASGTLALYGKVITNELVSENATIVGTFTGSNAVFDNITVQNAIITGTLQSVDGVFTGTLDGVDGNFIGTVTVGPDTVFAENYDPSTKETPEGAQAKANAAESNAKDYAAHGLLYARGTGYDRRADRILRLNDKQIYSNRGRGLRLTVINRNDLSISHDQNYDAYGSSEDRIALADRLNTLDDSVIVVLTSEDAFHYNRDGLGEAINRCGGSGVDIGGDVHYRTPYVLVGIPGIGKGAGIEVYTSNDPNAPYAEVSTKIVSGTPQGIDTTRLQLANQAEQEAKQHAEQKAQEAEDAARSYANTRANQAEQNAKDYAVGEDVNYNGVTIGASNGLVALRSDGKVRTVLNATDGIEIQRLVNGNWTSQLYADTNGNLRIAGTLEGVTGTFSGTVSGAIIEGSEIISEGEYGRVYISNNGYFEVSGTGNYGTITSINKGRLAVREFISSTEVPDYGVEIFPDRIHFFKNLPTEFSDIYWQDGFLHLETANGVLIDSNDLRSDTLTPNDSLDLNLYTPNGGRTIIKTDSGYGDFGARNTAYFHMDTDRPRFYMYKPLTVSGGLVSTGGYVESNSFQHTGNPNNTHLYFRGNPGQEVRIVDTTGLTTYIPIRASSFPTGSLEEYKQDIQKWEGSALDILKNADLYQYRLKSDVKNGIDKIRYGFIVGEGYRTPPEIMDDKGEGVEQYLMNSLSLKAIQELLERVEELEERM